MKPGTEPERYPEMRPRAATIRSKVMLEIASELVGQQGWGPKQVRVQFRHQGSSEWNVALFGSDAPSAIDEVAEGMTDVAIVNPAAVAAVARSGGEPFGEPVDLLAIATIPSFDQLGLAVASHTGIETLTDLAASSGALRISLRGERPDHSVHIVVGHLLSSVGTSLAQLEERGATLLYQPGLPHQSPRSEAIASGSVDVVIDEGTYNWVETAAENGFRFLSADDTVMKELEAMGHRRSTLTRDRYPHLEADVDVIDFSGFLIYTHARVSDDVVRRFCEALYTRADRIPWQGGPSLPIERMMRDTVDAPVPIPFHPAAEAYWVERGLIP